MGDVFHFHIVALQQHTGLFETNVVQIFIEAHWPTFLEQMRKIVRREIERLGDRFPAQRLRVMDLDVLTDCLEQRLAARGGLRLAAEKIMAVAEQADDDAAGGLLLLRLHPDLVERLQQKGTDARPATQRL